MVIGTQETEQTKKNAQPKSEHIKVGLISFLKPSNIGPMNVGVKGETAP